VALFEKARTPGTRQSVEGQYRGIPLSASMPRREPLAVQKSISHGAVMEWNR